MIVRAFARKVAKKKDDILSNIDPVYKVYKNYVDKEKVEGADNEEVLRKLIGDQSFLKVRNFIEHGKEIDVENFDINFPEELEKKLEAAVKKNAGPNKNTEVDKSLPSDIQSRLDKLNKK